jgi:acyl carrier protein
MEKFILQISEILEVERELLDLSTNFRADIPDWDSMKGFAIICMLDDDYGVRVNPQKFLEFNTIEDLYKLTL